MTAIAGAAQSQASPCRRFDQSKIIFGPRPTQQLNVDVVHFRRAGIVRNPTTKRQEAGSCTLNFIGWVSEGGQDEQDQGRGPNGFLPAPSQAKAAIRGGAPFQNLASTIESGGKLFPFERQGQ